MNFSYPLVIFTWNKILFHSSYSWYESTLTLFQYTDESTLTLFQYTDESTLTLFQYTDDLNHTDVNLL